MHHPCCNAGDDDHQHENAAVDQEQVAQQRHRDRGELHVGMVDETAHAVLPLVPRCGRNATRTCCPTSPRQAAKTT
jgi:hypothetical protein